MAATVDPSRRWRAYTHPLRVAILQLLEDGRPWRVTDIADAIGAAPNATSFHLKSLQQHGLIEPAPDADSREDRRTSIWRLATSPTEIPNVAPDSREFSQAVQVARAYEQQVLTRTSSWFAAATAEDSSVQTFNFDQVAQLSPQDTETLRTEVAEAIGRAVARSNPDAPDSSRVHLWGFGMVTPSPQNTPGGPETPSS